MAGPQVDRTEGEQWTRALLDRLRARRFTPAAWRDFLGDAHLRARETRTRRPDLTRQSRRWGAVGLAAALPFGTRPTAWWLTWWALIDWHLGMVETPDGRPQPLRTQDALTLARLWVAPIVRRQPRPVLIAAALASDVADGALAQRRGPTRLGRDLDSTADTLLLDQALRGAIEQHGLDPRLLTLERVRLIAAAGVVLKAYFARSEPTPPMPNRRPAAVLAGAGLLLATTGHPRAAERTLAAAVGYRALIRARAPTARVPD